MKTCLIIDDLELIRRVVRHMLQPLGFAISEAETADAALKLCAERMPDLILLDWRMPGLSAHEFILALRSARRGTMPHVIYCTTNSDASEITRMLASGANDFLLKPFEKSDLVDRLRARGVLAPPDEMETRAASIVAKH